MRFGLFTTNGTNVCAPPHDETVFLSTFDDIDDDVVDDDVVVDDDESSR
jgi:hypothetical protein